MADLPPVEPIALEGGGTGKLYRGQTGHTFILGPAGFTEQSAAHQLREAEAIVQKRKQLADMETISMKLYKYKLDELKIDKALNDLSKEKIKNLKTYSDMVGVQETKLKSVLERRSRGEKFAEGSQEELIANKMEAIVSRGGGGTAGTMQEIASVAGPGKGAGGIGKGLLGDVFLGPGGAHFGLAGLFGLARANPVIGGISLALTEAARLFGINPMDPLGSMREIKGIGKMTGEGFGAGISSRWQAFKLGANPFDIISMGMAREIATAVRTRGFRGQVGNALTDSIGSVVDTLGIDWKDALTPLEMTIRNSVGGTQELNSNLTMVTGQMQGLKDTLKQGALSIPIAELTQAYTTIAGKALQYKATPVGAEATLKTMTGVVGKTVPTDKLANLIFGDPQMMRVYAKLGGGEFLNPMKEGGRFVVQGYFEYLRMMAGGRLDTKAGRERIAALQDVIPGMAEFFQAGGNVAALAKIDKALRTGEMDKLWNKRTASERLHDLNIHDSAFKEQFQKLFKGSTDVDVMKAYESYKEYATGKSKIYPTKFMKTLEGLTPTQALEALSMSKDTKWGKAFSEAGLTQTLTNVLEGQGHITALRGSASRWHGPSLTGIETQKDLVQTLKDVGQFKPEVIVTINMDNALKKLLDPKVQGRNANALLNSLGGGRVPGKQRYYVP